MQPKPKLPGPKPGLKPAPGKAPLKPKGPAPAGARPATTRPYGASAPVARRPGMARKPNFIFLGGAAAMVLGFILPWFSVSVGPTSLNWGGWELPIQFNKLLRPFLDLADKAMEPGDPDRGKLDAMKTALSSLYAVYLIPVLCSAGVVDELLAFKKGRNWWWMRAIAAASPIIAFVVVATAFGALVAEIGVGGGGATDPEGGQAVGKDGPSVFSVLGFGVYVSFAGFAAATVGIFLVPKVPKAAEPGAAPAARPAGRPGGVTAVRAASSIRKAPVPGAAPAGPALQAEAQAVEVEAAAAEPAPQAVPAEAAAQPEPEPAPAGPPPNATTPRAAAVQILALAANVEAELAVDRLDKARAAAGKLLGEGSRADIDAWMTSPLPVTDFAAQMAEVADLVGSNAKLAQGVIKCAQFALKAADGSFTEGAQIVLDTLQQQFPAPQPVPAPPAAIAPAPPPIQTAPPPVYAPAPPPAGYAPAPPPAAPGVALPRQRRRRPM